MVPSCGGSNALLSRWVKVEKQAFQPERGGQQGCYDEKRQQHDERGSHRVIKLAACKCPGHISYIDSYQCSDQGKHVEHVAEVSPWQRHQHRCNDRCAEPRLIRWGRE